MDVLGILLEFVAGLVLFLYGVTRLSEALKLMAGEKMKDFLKRCTTNRFAALATGAVATTILDSSSVTIIMLIATVNAGLLSFEHSLGVILGSNIGTTVSSQLFALNVDRYAPVGLALGFLLYMLGNNRYRNRGMLVFGVGLVFFGLHVMSEAMAPLKDHKPVLDWIKRLENPLAGALTGAVVTAVIQSSSAVMGIIITMASSGMISLPAGIALMLGAEVGTCTDTLLATIGRSRAALRAGIFHLSFNIITAALGVAFAAELAQLVRWVSGSTSVERQIANAHVLFNVLGAALFIGFIPVIARSLRWILPPKEPAEEYS